MTRSTPVVEDDEVGEQAWGDGAAFVLLAPGVGGATVYASSQRSSGGADTPKS
ncbi:MAG: hypothetical protein R2699_11665 [Acidimicrobiales bacterium]